MAGPAGANMIFEFESKAPKIAKTAYVAPNAAIIGEVEIEAEASIWFNCVVRGDINRIFVGRGSNIQDSCVLHVTNHHPMIVQERVTVGHGAILHGATIESDCLIAMGAIILDGALIGSHSVVAAGSLVAPGTQIPPGSLVMGVPGKVVRQVTDRDREMIEIGWQNYVGYQEQYRRSLKQLD